MRIVAFSDTHRNTELLQWSVRQAVGDGPIDAFIHCGDGVRDLAFVGKALRNANPEIQIYAVRGNCDPGTVHYPISELVDLGGVRTFITHGHLHHVKHGLGKLAKAALDMHATLVFFGHTHEAVVAHKYGVTLINPGSLVSWPPSGIAYLEVIIDADGSVREHFVKQRQKPY